MEMNPRNIAIFAPRAGRDFGEKVCAHLGVSLSAHEEREFEDGALIIVSATDVVSMQYGERQRPEP